MNNGAHFVQVLQGFEPNDREDVFMFYASALQSLQYFYQTQVRSLPCLCVHDMLGAFEGLTYRSLVVDNFSWKKLEEFCQSEDSIGALQVELTTHVQD